MFDDIPNSAVESVLAAVQRVAVAVRVDVHPVPIYLEPTSPDPVRVPADRGADIGVRGQIVGDGRMPKSDVAPTAVGWVWS